MSLYRAVRSELVKLRHTPLLPIHIIVPIAGAILFTSYFGLYRSQPDYKKYKLMFEITATFFPLLISIITGLNTLMEDHTAHAQPILSVPKRKTVFVESFSSSWAVALFLWLVWFSCFQHWWQYKDWFHIRRTPCC